MTKREYEELVHALTDALSVVADLKVKQQAWETVIRHHNSSVYQAYMNEIGRLKNGKDFETQLVMVSNLKQRLLRERI